MHIDAHLDIDLVALDEADQVTCLLELTAPADINTAKRPGRTLVVVLDRSGSMSGEPIEASPCCRACLKPSSNVPSLATPALSGGAAIPSKTDLRIMLTR